MRSPRLHHMFGVGLRWISLRTRSIASSFLVGNIMRAATMSSHSSSDLKSEMASVIRPEGVE